MTNEPRTIPLASAATWLSGGTPDRTNGSYWGGSIPWVSAATLKRAHIDGSDQYLTEAGVLSGSKMAPAGASLVLVRGMALHREIRIGMATRPVSFNQDIKALIPRSGLLPAFLLYSLQALSGQILDLVSSAGSGTGVLNTQLLQRLEIWIPDEQVQRRVVAAIEAAETYVSTLERLIAKKQQIKQGMMQQLLTGKVRLPGFADPWRNVLLGDHVRYLKTVALSRAQLNQSAPLRYLHYGDIHTCSDVHLDAVANSMPRAPRTLADRASRLKLGDVVFADASEDISGVGKAVEISAVPSEGLVPGLHTIAARFDKTVLADGFKGYLRFIPDFREALLRLAAGTKVLATTRSSISSVALPLPPIEEQQAIAEVLIDADHEIAILQARAKKARNVKQGNMQELLIRRTRVLAHGATA